MARKKRLFYIETLGCPKNLVDSEVIVSNMLDAGYEVTSDPQRAELIIINTCGFIEPAKEESIDVILDFVRFKNESVCKKLIVTGCLVQRYKDELAQSMPEVDHFFGLDDISGITQALGLHEHFEDKRYILTPQHYAYLRISDGCENFCSYCAIPYIRGSVQSKPIEDILHEAQQLVHQGVKELIVIAQDIGNYGIDIYGKSQLVELLQKLDTIKGLRWLRLLYLNPQHVTEELLITIRNSKHICKYLDIPLQHISDHILKSMSRKTSKQDILNALSLIKMITPDISIRTTLILGFPGETDGDFEELLDLIKKEKFDHLGAFTYFQEDGTKAASLPDQVSEKTKQKRYDIIMEAQQAISKDKLEDYIGKKLTVIVDKKIKSKIYECRSEFDAPDIDGIVYLEEADVEIGNLVEVEIVDSLEYDLIAHPKKNRHRSNSMRRIFSGIQPSGKLHIGNYLGAIKNWIGLQNENDCIWGIVDYHSMTIPYDHAGMENRVIDCAATYLAAGLDPEKCVLMIQSKVKEHTELTWILNTVTPISWLERVPTFKDKSKRFIENVNMGLMDYPVLMAADIILYKAEAVPVGEDQLPHLELTREIVRRFNNVFGDTFPEPKAITCEGALVRGLDGQAKMSKSLDNCLYIDETPEDIWKKLSVAVTDPQRVRKTDPGDPKICNIFSLHQLFSTKEQIAYCEEGCRTAGIGCIQCKKILAENITNELAPIREKKLNLLSNIDYIKDVLEAGIKHSQKIATQTIEEVYEKIGTSYKFMKGV